MGMIQPIKFLQSHGIPRYENLGMDLINQSNFYNFLQTRIVRVIG